MDREIPPPAYGGSRAARNFSTPQEAPIGTDALNQQNYLLYITLPAVNTSQLVLYTASKRYYQLRYRELLLGREL